MRIVIRSLAILCSLSCLLSIIACGSGSSAAAFRLPPPPPPPNPCWFLNVNVTTTSGEAISVPNDGVACDHGNFVGNNPNSQNVQSVTVEQSSVYGPDCNFTFNMGGSTYVIRAQQNFCSSEGGNVTASVVSGNATITGTSSGSYQSSSGAVNVTLN